MDSDRRNILLIAPFFPYPADFGGALRIFHLIQGLQYHHNVHLIAPVTAKEAGHVLTLGDLCDVTAVPSHRTARDSVQAQKRLAQVRALGSTESFLARSLNVMQLQAAVDRIFLTRRVDLVQYEFAQTALVRAPRRVPTIIDAHNIEHTLLQRVARTSTGIGQEAFNTLEWRKVRRLEEHAWKSATATLTTSTVDAEIVQRVTRSTVEVVPNGVDIHAFDGVDVQRRRNQIIFTGAMRHHPNASGACWYVRHVHPRVQKAIPDATIHIVGADPTPEVLELASDSVVVTGRVERIEPYLAASAVAVVPLHSGSGTRLKILDAFASRTPVVSTTIGAEGIEAIDGEHFLVRDSPESFAEAVVALLRDEERSEQMTENAYRLAQDRYDWKTAVIPQLVAAHDRAILEFARTSEGGA